MATEQAFQARFHQVQRDLMARYFNDLTRAAEQGDAKVGYMLVSGQPIELLRLFDILPVYPEVNVLQLAVKKQALPYIQSAEEMGYSMDNCAYVKADVGLWFNGRQTPFAKIPKPSIIIQNYAGCAVYLNWFEHLAEYTGAPIYSLDAPGIRPPGTELLSEDVQYIVGQLKELIRAFEKLTGKKYDEDKLREIMTLSRETGIYWAKIKKLAQLRPSPFDAFFDCTTLMAPLYIYRGTQEGLDFFREAYNELAEKTRLGIGVVPEERFRYVIEGAPPWPYLRTFRNLFSRWGAVAVASTYSTVGGIWEFGFTHDPFRPLESIAEFMLANNLANRTFKQRYEQIERYLEDWHADGLIIHSIKSCRMTSAGLGDMREYFVHDRGIPTLLVESDIEDPRYFSEAQMRNRIDAFFETLEHRKLVAHP